MLASLLIASIGLLPGIMSDTVDDVANQTAVQILAPSRLPTVIEPLFTSGEGTRRSYQLVVSTQEDCGANACSLAYFSGNKGGKLYGGRKVTLANGRKGRYYPLSCGGSCSPPSISWRERGNTYELQMEFADEQSPRTELVKMANSAIRNGPR